MYTRGQNESVQVLWTTAYEALRFPFDGSEGGKDLRHPDVREVRNPL